MRNSLFIIAISLACCTRGQVISADSRPFLFSIERNDACEGKSIAYAFEIRPRRVAVHEAMESQVVKWFEKEGRMEYRNPEFEEILDGQIASIRRGTILETALALIEKADIVVSSGSSKNAISISANGFEKLTLMPSPKSTRLILNDTLKPVMSFLRVELNRRDNFEILEMKVNFGNSVPEIHYRHPDESKIEAVRISVFVPFEDLYSE